MKKLVVLAVAGLMSVTVSAANWIFIGEGDSVAVKLYVDLDSISQSNNIAKAFIKNEYEQSQGIGGSAYDKTVTLREFHCNEKPIKLRSLSVRSYLGDKRVFARDKPTEFTYSYPDTFGEAAAKFVCSIKK